MLEFRGQFVDTKRAQLDDFVDKFVDEIFRTEPFIKKDLLAQSNKLNISIRSCRKVFELYD